jgi:hypothetical protein
MEVRYQTDGPVVSGDIKEAAFVLRAPLIRLDTIPTVAEVPEDEARQQGSILEDQQVLVQWCWDEYPHPKEGVPVQVGHPFSSRREATFGITLFVHAGGTTPVGQKGCEDQSQLVPVLMVETTDKEGQFRRPGTARIALTGGLLVTPLSSRVSAFEYSRSETTAERCRERLVERLESLDTEVITLV